MTRETIINKLVSINYTEGQAQQVADELLSVDSSLSDILSSWVLNSVETDFSAEGFSLLELKEKYQMTYPAALLTIDWLIKEPEIAVGAVLSGVK